MRGRSTGRRESFRLGARGSPGGNGRCLLRDLVPLWQVAIEIVLALETGDRMDLAAEGEGGPEGLMHSLLVEDRQGPWGGVNGERKL